MCASFRHSGCTSYVHCTCCLFEPPLGIVGAHLMYTVPVACLRQYVPPLGIVGAHLMYTVPVACLRQCVPPLGRVGAHLMSTGIAVYLWGLLCQLLDEFAAVEAAVEASPQ